MSQQVDFEEDAAKKQYTKPHSGKHPIPTIQQYREHRKELDSREHEAEQAQQGPEDQAKTKRAYESVKAIFKGDDVPASHHDPYPSANRNYANGTAEMEDEEPHDSGVDTSVAPDASEEQINEPKDRDKKEGKQEKSATEAVASAVNPKEKRKIMKKTKRDAGGREVTDPVTHLPLVIRDQTEKDLRSVPENQPQPGANHRTATGLQGASKSNEELDKETAELQVGHNGMQRVLFPPPEFSDLKKELQRAYQTALYAGLAAIGAIAALFFALPAILHTMRESWPASRKEHQWSMFASESPADPTYYGIIVGQGWNLLFLVSFLALASGVVISTKGWLGQKVNSIFDDEVWSAARQKEAETVTSDAELPESVQWLNSLLASIWPLINPDLFASLVDQIEDVMQASLPKVIKMVSVDDMAQGSESIRILGIKWLPTGAASRTVEPDGKLEEPDKKHPSDHEDPNSGQQVEVDKGDESHGTMEQDHGNKKDEQEESAIREGMEAESGDFVNLELAIAYRSRSSGTSLSSKAKNAHLYLKFYLPGGIAVPVWVELRGIVATARVRMQLGPDPPFVSLCTLTFLGQPKADLSCVPLSKHNLNIMNVPMISSFVQSAIDAALAEYVAPKSLTLNLKDMLVGADFKIDTLSRGVVWIFIKHAKGFKQGDGGVGPVKGSSDAYVTVSWGKFGKPVASTRIIMNDDSPVWHEHSSILVTVDELNAQEKLRLQLWDSDKWTADDDLGRVELDLKRLMNNPETCNKIKDREDRFTGEDPDEMLPGTLTWSVGYFPKARITQEQLESQTVNEELRTKDQLKQHVANLSEHKLREANKKSTDDELHQQKAQDYKELEDAMINSAPPNKELPSGILSIQIHNITGLGIQSLQKKDNGDDEDREDVAEQGDELPDAYCVIILDHKKIYKTRTKPKNAKPFYNASTERFIKDWTTSELIVSVRDRREGEDDALLGLVYLPFSKIFAERSQVVDNYTLAGGIGYGRARISLVWRSVELQLPPNLKGWDYGTIEFCGPVKPKGDLPKDLTELRLKLRTNMGRFKMYPHEGEWRPSSKKQADNAFLAVRKRYASTLIIEFRTSSAGPDKTRAFAVIWLQDIVDEEAQTVTLKVWKSSKKNLKRASTCCDYTGMEEGEQPLGEIELTMKFWRGLSGFHKGYAAQVRNNDMREVMECLDTVNDERLDDAEEFDEANDEPDSDGDPDEADSRTRKKLKVHVNDETDRSDDDDNDEEDGGAGSRGSSPGLSKPRFKDLKKVQDILRNPVDGTITTAASMIAPGHNDQNDASRGLRNQIRDYKDHHKQLHRKHRGVMQWRTARQIDHLGAKVSSLKGKVTDIFRHGEKETGVETEV